MNVTLSPKHEALIRKKVESGQFEDANEFFEAALRLWEEHERFLRLKAALASADGQYRRGEAVPLTPELIENIKRRAKQMEMDGEEPDPDVWPQ